MLYHRGSPPVVLSDPQSSDGTGPMTNRDRSAPKNVDVSKVHEVLQTETGGRKLTGPASMLVFVVPLVWWVFLLWIASPFAFVVNFGIFNSTEARAIHLAFATFL